jgi:hypothetical protein
MASDDDEYLKRLEEGDTTAHRGRMRVLRLLAEEGNVQAIAELAAEEAREQHEQQATNSAGTTSASGATVRST